MNRRHFLKRLGLASPVLLTGCANPGSVSQLISDVTGVVTDVAATAADVDTVVAAVQQNNNGKPITVASLVSDAEAAATAINSSGLASTAETIAGAVNQTIADAQAAGATPAATVAAVSAQSVALQVAASTAVSGTTGTSYFRLHARGRSFRLCIVKSAWKSKAT